MCPAVWAGPYISLGDCDSALRCIERLCRLKKQALGRAAIGLADSRHRLTKDVWDPNPW